MQPVDDYNIAIRGNAQGILPVKVHVPMKDDVQENGTSGRNDFRVRLPGGSCDRGGQSSTAKAMKMEQMT